MTRKKVAVIGAGPAGMMAAIAAAADCDVTLFEKNEKTGKKLYITGKGRCNVTNACERQDFFENIVSNPRFLYSSFDEFSNRDVCEALKLWGLPLKTGRGNRVFPQSDKASDVTKTLEGRMKEMGVKVCLNTKVTRIETAAYKGEAGKYKLECTGVRAGERFYSADAVIVATGGLSYPQTGSDGDGYRFARDLGLEVTELSPSLVGLRCLEAAPARLSGITLKNVEARIEDARGRTVYRGFGEMLFTHFGVSGPLMLTASALISGKPQENLRLFIDFKPALDSEKLDKKILGMFAEGKNKTLKGAVGAVLPERLLDEVLLGAQLDPKKRVSEVTRREREGFIKVLKAYPLTITGLLGYNEAIVTKGGVKTSQLNPKTMESKLIRGLHFAGEVIDVDGLTGGFNLQIAWSTGHAAGSHIC